MSANELGPEWSDLRLLLAFEEERTLQGVAVVSKLTPSTVSRRLRALEQSLGARLVENIAGRLTLTDAGRRAAQAAARMRSHTDELVRTIRGKDSRVEGTVRLGLLEVFVRYHGDAFRAFREAHPRVVLHFLVDGARRHRLTRREADVVLRATRTPPDTLVGRRLMNLAYAPFAAPSHADRGWTNLPWIAWESALNATQTEGWIQAQGGTVCARVTTTASMLDLASAGLGACVVPVIYGRSSGLTQLCDPLPGFDVPLWILTHRDLADSAPISTLTRFMGDHFSRLRRAD
jgi:DNA-binding transcriptional LysR family regulator